MQHGYTSDELNEPGIYAIINTVTGKRYVGATMNRFRDRYNQHRCDLSLGRHANKVMQADWNVYGPKMFQFVILEPVTRVFRAPRDYLDDRELWHIDNSPAGVYNGARTTQALRVSVLNR